jgi:WhiB family transcriptional regulator, redox-sensing transcriptional regulator
MPRPMKFEVVVHGYGGYTAGCSCEICKEAKAKRERDRRAGRVISKKGKPRLVKFRTDAALGDLGWQLRSACASEDPDLFFSEDQGDIERAKAICAGCPVRSDCDRYMQKVAPEFGVFAGLAEDERRMVAA